MLKLTIALLLGLIVACAGGDETGPLSPGATTTTSDGRVSGNLQQTAGSEATRESGTPRAGTAGQTPPASLHDTLTPEAGRTPAAESEAPTGPVVTLGGVPFLVELAVTSRQRIQGLSGHPPLAPGAGMLFVFEQAGRYSFWMREMLFSLDMVWIDAECNVVHITRDAPPQRPDQDLDDLPRYGPPVPALYVLEINAGAAESNAVTVGSTVRFDGTLAGSYGC
ncbi:MAG: hypothetical protein BZY88_08915 [SAR202 cluster bacterium Io17-Chloro-G9]|nr:MAG: hypothetical protein BZY88_08915 [SAR202 cluster bacterium Io17-Chloro-G9]